MLGILFLVSSAKGHSLTFSYPYPPMSEVWGFKPDFMASLLSPKTNLCDQSLILNIDGRNYIGRAATFLSGLHFNNLCQSETALSMMNIVLVTRKIKAFYPHLLNQVSSILVYEQVRRNFVKDQVDLIANIRETQDIDLNKKILHVSSLARALANVYHYLCNPNANILQKKYDALSMDDIFDPCILLKNIHPPNVIDEAISRMRPYQALLLLADEHDILNSLPLGSSPLIIELVKKADPLKCFEEYEILLNCSLSQIYKLVAHLVFWKRAKVIDAISIRNVYVVSPRADLSQISRLHEKFNQQFSDLKVSAPPKFKELSIPSEAFLEIVNPEVFLIATPEAPSEKENDLLMNQKSHTPALDALFNRLLPFLNGKYHVDEILSRENLTRKELKAVVGHYRDEIITALYYAEE